MDRERFKRVADLFRAALEQQPEARAEFLKDACDGDEELRGEVERLLRIEEEAGSFLERPAALPVSPEDPASRLVGTRIGRYLIRRVLSSGGMGIVFEALQERPERTVALKVIRQGIISPSAARRFEYEAQVLARLHHPHIAQIIEAGTHLEGEESSGGTAEVPAAPGEGPTASVKGLPYLVMEYIPEARSITDYARQKDLSTRERLDLFTQVCQAVDHGHRQGIIHRDLKPSNILVDPEGVVKIIDFGVARALDPELTPATAYTEAGQLIGTLQYMSPEQCEADGQGVDTRSDVYALGVVLYELLCEELPYNVERAAIFEALRLIREEPPRRPSSVKRALRGDMETAGAALPERFRSQWRHPPVSSGAGDPGPAGRPPPPHRQVDQEKPHRQQRDRDRLPGPWFGRRPPAPLVVPQDHG